VHHWNAEKNQDEAQEVISIAGNEGDGDYEKWEAKQLPPPEGGEGTQDKDKGVRVTLKGGHYQGREQLAVVDFRCNTKLEGTEGEWESEDEYEKPSAKVRRADEKKDEDKDKAPPSDGEPEKQRKHDGAALIWDGYKRSADDKSDTLYLTWYSKYTCEASADEPGSESSRWGVFTWLVLL
jgi:hypothetical protein